MPHNTHWTEQEDAYLLANHELHDHTFIAKVLERTESAVKNRLNRIDQESGDISPEMEFLLTRAKRVKPAAARKYNSVIENTPRLSGWTGKGNPYAHTKSGYRPDLKLSPRSGWEANFLRILKSFKIPFDYEPKIFTFPVKRGNKAYTPDIYLKNTGEWIEIKGYMDKNSEIKLKRLSRHYPEEFSNMILVTGSKKNIQWGHDHGVPTVLDYRVFKKLFQGKLPNWEGK